MVGIQTLSIICFLYTKSHFTHETKGMWPLHFKRSHWWKRRSQSKFNFTLRFKHQRSNWMQDGCQVYMDSYMASSGPCFMVTWTIFKNYLLEIGLKQNRETMAIQNPTTVDLFFYHVWGPHMNRYSMKQHLVEGPVTYDFTLHLSARDQTTLIWKCPKAAFEHFLGALTMFGHGSWLACEMALSIRTHQVQNWISISHSMALGRFSWSQLLVYV